MTEGTIEFYTSNRSKLIMGGLATMIGAMAYLSMRYCVDATNQGHNQVIASEYVLMKRES